MKRVLVLFTLFSIGCARTHSADVPRREPNATTTAEGDDDFVAPLPSASAAPSANASAAERLVAEGVRELRAMKSTRYRHKTNVDEAAGLFEFDCSGFVAYALAVTHPSALAAIPLPAMSDGAKKSKRRPKAEQFATFFAGLAENATDGAWTRVARASQLQAGDVIAWLRPSEVDNGNTGHVVIALDAPKKIAATKPVRAIGGSAEWLVRVVDSTESPHADDARVADEVTGLGTGTIGIVVDAFDTPIGYRWKGGESTKAYATLVAIGRVR